MAAVAAAKGVGGNGTSCHWHGPRQCKAIKERRTSGTAITYNPEDRVLVRPIRPALLDQLLAKTAARNLTAVLSACSSHKSKRDAACAIQRPELWRNDKASLLTTWIMQGLMEAH
jgi:hypothetical protein